MVSTLGYMVRMVSRIRVPYLVSKYGYMVSKELKYEVHSFSLPSQCDTASYGTCSWSRSFNFIFYDQSINSLLVLG